MNYPKINHLVEPRIGKRKMKAPHYRSQCRLSDVQSSIAQLRGRGADFNSHQKEPLILTPRRHHQNYYPIFNSFAKDYPKPCWRIFAFCRTLRKCEKALSENYPTNCWFFFWTIRTSKKTIRKVFRPATSDRGNISNWARSYWTH